MSWKSTPIPAVPGSPIVMGILNVTPDSFSDGGEFFSIEAAVIRGLAMIAEGAAIIDVGPESTRPGSLPVAADEQIRRAIPVIERLRERKPAVSISIDTRLASVATAAIDAGADVVNDVSALRDDPDMAGVVARSGVSVVLMHRRGTSADMQSGGGPDYDDVVPEIAEFLRERIAFCERTGIATDRIIIDPGIGFGKRVEHNLAILRNVPCFAALGRPVLIGLSRKSFLGAILDLPDPRTRDDASLVAAILAVIGGASIIRTHAVAATVEAMRVCTALTGPLWEERGRGVGGPGVLPSKPGG